ncbi:MAG: ankyrin repeat domain-containing protein [Armatimonadota bacterium]
MTPMRTEQWRDTFWRALVAEETATITACLAECRTARERTQALQWALLRASMVGHLHIVQQILAWEVNPNTRDACGRTALHRAATHGHVPIITHLIECGANIEARDVLFKMTPLHIAARHRQTAAVICLLSLGADSEMQDVFGVTPGAIARQMGDDDLVMIFRFPEMIRQTKRSRRSTRAKQPIGTSRES